LIILIVSRLARSLRTEAVFFFDQVTYKNDSVYLCLILFARPLHPVTSLFISRFHLI